MPGSNDFFRLFFRSLVIYHIIENSFISCVVQGLRFFAATENTLLAPKNGFTARSLDDGCIGSDLLYVNILQPVKRLGKHTSRRARQTVFNAVTTPQSELGYQSTPSASNTGSTKNERSKDDLSLEDASSNDFTSGVQNTTSFQRMPSLNTSSVSSRQKQRSQVAYQPKPLGKWEFNQGNYVLRPSAFNNDPTESQPKAVLHFLGGAMIGAGKCLELITDHSPLLPLAFFLTKKKYFFCCCCWLVTCFFNLPFVMLIFQILINAYIAPQIAYRYLLERLARENYLIVTTPFSLSFNHLQTCDDVIEKFERVAPTLAQQYGPIPVIGVGHSLGGLLQVLITSLFPDTPRAGNIIMSFNNKGVKESVPLFEELVTPLFVSLADENSGLAALFNALSRNTSKNDTDVTSSRTDIMGSKTDGSRKIGKSSVDGLNLILSLARTGMVN